ncbi:hypothetical protein SLS60_008007 [Paraconiothyrium brasiliense]|uniref:Amidase domain-containing protein n=1 Tax=Paraconiothyrium brasiliense TaxID=300254 RepID=A0ABR3R344_9PLEO
MTQALQGFNIVEASIAQHKEALSTSHINSVDLVISYLNRIATYDILDCCNAFTVFNSNVFEEAAASDARRAAGHPARPLEGIPYTIKDSYKVAGLTVTNGSPALAGLLSNEDSGLAKQLRDAGAILIGKTSMPPMAAGGMQRGLYGRPESPYNRKYLPAAFSSGSSSGAAVSIASSMGVFGLGSETVSSGRSPGSNNGLVVYTPSKGVLSCCGLWPLYVTCDVAVPLARSVEDMLAILDVIGTPQEEKEGDFWREQTIVNLPMPQKPDYQTLAQTKALQGKRIGVPKMYVGGQDADPHAKPTVVSMEVISLWNIAAAQLSDCGAEIIYTDFPIVTNYENDSKSGEMNNVLGAPSDWNLVERSTLIAKAWSDFLAQNQDPRIKSLADVDPLLLFPKPKDYLPDTWLEVRNWVHYSALPSFEAELKDVPITKFPGLEQVLPALEAQRKRDLEDWMTDLGLDCVAFPSQGDVGLADLESELESARHSLQNGVKYSNGNRALRHLGVPTVSVPMGVMQGKQMPVNLTFAGKAYEDEKLLMYAYAYEQRSKARIPPPLTPPLESDMVMGPWRTLPKENMAVLQLTASAEKILGDEDHGIQIQIALQAYGAVVETVMLEVWVNGTKCWGQTMSELGQWLVEIGSKSLPIGLRQETLGWDLKPLKPRPTMVIVVARAPSALPKASLLWLE